MTNKEFFIKTLDAEGPIFIRLIKAVPEDKADFKPHEKARSARHIAIQLGAQAALMSSVIKTGTIDFGKPYTDENQSIADAAASAEKNFAQVKKDLAGITDEDWEKTEVKMIWPGGEWKTQKFHMVWDFLFDGIHHRGQLSTYIRVMGGKVPSIYGGSADEGPSA